MTPLQLAREECSNFRPDGSCLGIIYDGNARIVRACAKPHCVVHEKRCQFFEDNILPMVNLVKDKKRRDAITGARSRYMARTHGQPGSDT